MSDTDRTQHEHLILRINELIPELSIGAGSMVTDLMIMVKSTDMDGDVSMHIAHTMKKDWILRLGFIHAAMDIEDSNPEVVDKDGEN